MVKNETPALLKCHPISKRWRTSFSKVITQRPVIRRCVGANTKKYIHLRPCPKRLLSQSKLPFKRVTNKKRPMEIEAYFETSQSIQGSGDDRQNHGAGDKTRSSTEKAKTSTTRIIKTWAKASCSLYEILVSSLKLLGVVGTNIRTNDQRGSGWAKSTMPECNARLNVRASSPNWM